MNPSTAMLGAFDLNDLVNLAIAAVVLLGPILKGLADSRKRAQERAQKARPVEPSESERGSEGRRAWEALLRGEEPGHYASHTTWASRADFEAWTRSEAFRKAHAQAPLPKGLLLGHPQLVTWEAVLEEEPGASARRDTAGRDDTIGGP